MPDIDPQAAKDAKIVKDEAAKQQREQEERMLKAQILRADLALALADIGYEETLFIKYTQEGIFPGIRLAALDPEQAAAVKIEVQKHRDDLVAMGKPPSGIVGLDGEPLMK
jgi:hypothetical protein